MVVILILVSEIIFAYEVGRYRTDFKNFKSDFSKLKSKYENHNKVRAPMRQHQQRYRPPPQVKHFKRSKPGPELKQPIIQENMALFFSKPENALTNNLNSGKYTANFDDKPVFENILVAPPQPTAFPEKCEHGIAQLEHNLNLPSGLQNDNFKNGFEDINTLETGRDFLRNKLPSVADDSSYTKYSNKPYPYPENFKYTHSVSYLQAPSDYGNFNHPYGNNHDELNFGNRQVNPNTLPKVNDFVTPSQENILKFSNEDAVDPQYVGKIYTSDGGIKFYSKVSDSKDVSSYGARNNALNYLDKEPKVEENKRNVRKVQQKRRRKHKNRLE